LLTHKRYPDTVSLPDVLAQIPDGPEGRKFVSDLADFIYKKFGVYVPDFVGKYHWSLLAFNRHLC